MLGMASRRPKLQVVKQVTLIVPTLNAADSLARCIDSCRGLFDELLLVDSFSTDATCAIAEGMGARIIVREYENSASQKNWAIPQASHSWILLLDADEWLSPELHAEIAAWRASSASDAHDGYWIYRANYFLGRPVRFSGWQGDKVIRLFQRDRSRYAPKQVHAEIETSGSIGRLKYRMNHNTFVDLPSWEAKLRRYAEWQAGDYDARTPHITPYHTMLKPAWRFLKHFVLRGGILDGYVGYKVSAYAAWAVWLRYDVLRRRRTSRE